MGRIWKAIDGTLGLKVIETPICSGNSAVVELKAIDVNTGGVPVSKNGYKYDNRYAWVIYTSPETGKIVKVRAYFDSAMVVKVLKDQDI